MAAAPPGSSAPAFVQGFRYVRDPLGFLTRYRERYGDVFTVRFPFFGEIVYVASPELVKAVFTGSPAVFHAGEANATVLEPALGPSSVLTLDDEPHLQARKLLLPPFHGERIRRYGELIEEVTRRDMETWPLGEPFALRPHTQRITLTVILRAVFGIDDEARIERATHLIDEFSDRVTTITRLPFLRRGVGRRLGPCSVSCGRGSGSTPSSTRRSRCVGATPRARIATTSSRCCCGRATTTARR
ncbi:MAG TPA: cytochrome P450 [Solirubrobacterales bacterium]|nr:cytochrome P450 [Solirubrobacterales bacterium]